MENASGFINLNKPSGISSAAAVARVKRITHIACGHMGTLDPLACGVLPVAVGNASRLFGYLLNKEKIYRAVFRFGEETDTLDSTGTLLRTGLPVPSAEEIEGVLSSFLGEIDQLPPAYSAKSVGGVRAYRLAREGKQVEMAPRKVRINSLHLIGQKSGSEYEFLVSCEGGTYIRSLGRDIAGRCGTVAVMTSLVREKSGFFTLGESISPEDLTEENWQTHLIPPELVFDLHSLDFDGKDAWRLRSGQRIPFEGENGEYKLFLDDELYGIALAENGNIRAKVKLV